VRLILLGAPGAGKGTQAKMISERFGIPHISTGDILRSELKNNTELGNKADEYMKAGKLVPDELIIEIIRHKLENGNPGNPFLMDGFPRTLNQAIMFDEMLKSLNIGIDRVINIFVDEEELVKRLTGRRVCHSCAGVCHINSIKQSGTNRCPVCGGELYTRKDDDIEVIRERLHVYEQQTKPLIDYYEKSGILYNVDGKGTEKEITERLMQVL